LTTSSRHHRFDFDGLALQLGFDFGF